MKIYNFEQGTEEWFIVRQGKLTASSAQAIASKGAGLDTLVYEKVAEILTGKIKPSFTNEDIERGHELEATARNSYELDSGDLVKQVGFIELDDFVGCSPDGLVGDKGLLEVKCKNDANFVKYLYTDKVDSAHNWQMQYQMYVTDREWVDYVIFNENFNPTTVIKRVERNETEIAKIKAGIAIGTAKIQSILEKIQNGQK